MNELNVISLGAGKQSSYMLLTALEGKYNLIPDFAIFSDTGCEPEYVYQYLDMLTEHCYTKYGFNIIKVQTGDLINDTLNYINCKIKRVASLPLWIKNGGFNMRQCTQDYKIAPLRKYLQSVRNKRKVKLWIGISVDEIERIKDSGVNYITNYYPLIENKINISDIRQWFKLNNFQEPGKSACLICPFHSINYWKIIKKNYPSEFKKACDFDDKIRNYPNFESELYLFRYRRPLKNINLEYENSLFPELIEECYGLCGL
jgi:hypothetical protein